MLALASAMLVVVGLLTIPILTHSSAGSSGQEVPDGFVSETTATGADGRTRTVAVTMPDGEPADLARLQPGETLVVSGTGYDSKIGIYVSICAIPSLPGEKPSPCLGGIPETSEGAAVAESSVWITNNWAWAAFATHGYDDAGAGSFVAELTVPGAVSNGLDCTKVLCAITTRSDHTAASDRIQDIQLPVAFRE